VVVLQLKHLGIALEIVEVVDGRQRKLALEIRANHGDLRVVEGGAVEELAPLGRQLAVVGQREALQDHLLLVGQPRVLGLVGCDILGRDFDIARRLEDSGLTDKQKMILQASRCPTTASWRPVAQVPRTPRPRRLEDLRGSRVSPARVSAVDRLRLHDFQRNAQVFQLQDNHGKVAQVTTMTAEFFDAHRDLEIRAWIEKHRLAYAMRQAGQSGVLVTPAGLQIERR